MWVEPSPLGSCMVIFARHFFALQPDLMQYHFFCISNKIAAEEVIHWTEPLETVVKKEAERSAALAWAHEASQRWCANWNTRLMFPSIVIATFTGAGAVGAENMLPFEGATTLVGILTLVVGTLQTIQNYFAFAKRSESHRISSLQYGKMHSMLALQLSLPRNERKPAKEIIDLLRDETDRMSEIAPLIPSAIKEVFTKKFGEIENFAVPAVLNGLEPVHVTTDEAIYVRPKIVVKH